MYVSCTPDLLITSDAKIIDQVRFENQDRKKPVRPYKIHAFQ